MRIIAFLFACLAFNSYPAEYIDEQLVLNLLEKEKQSVQKFSIMLRSSLFIYLKISSQQK